MRVQRLGAFFQEMRAQQPAQSTWAPSPMGSPPQQGTRRAIGSPESEADPWGQAQRAFVPGQQSLLTARTTSNDGEESASFVWTTSASGSGA